MDSSELSLLSSLRDDFKSEDYVQPHYKEAYRLAIDRLLDRGRESYQEFLKEERLGSFLSDQELLFISENAEQLPPQDQAEETTCPPDSHSSSGTYWPLDSDTDAPDLDLGWPQFRHDTLQTNIDLLFHPPRQNNHTIKEVVRKNIQEARQVISIVMDTFTDVDIFKEVVDASFRGVPVYILLDELNLKSFLAMAESQDIKIQQLRNMRVRTAKGQPYVCRTGAKFHGAMLQRFLLVDCHTAIYGSYSFTWSCEKINLSMVQVITGHLVKSYDEEFRTLYARSSMPAELCPVESSFQQILPKSYSGQKIERKDHLRHSLDTVYRKTCERTLGTTRNFQEQILEEELNGLGPLVKNSVSGHKHMPHFQSAEAGNFLKRHSYAGERHEVGIPENIWPRASNWNISRETGNQRNYLHTPPGNRGQQLRKSWNCNDKLPTIEKTSSSFMRTLRIESYLQNTDSPVGDSTDYLDQFEHVDKASTFMQGRLRSSLAFKSTIQEQVELNRNIINSPTVQNSLAQTNAPVQYSSMQWNSKTPAENRMSKEEFMFKRQSLQIMDDSSNNATNPGPGRNFYNPAYASLGRNKSGHMIKNSDNPMDSWHKRHSVADPRSNGEYTHESSSHMYGAFARANRRTAEKSEQIGGFGSLQNEDHRSVSQCDVNTFMGNKSQNSSIWQETPSRTVSAAALHVNNKDLPEKGSSVSSRLFMKKSSQKIKTFLNIHDKKEDAPTVMKTQSVKSSGSTATLTGDDRNDFEYEQGEVCRGTSRADRFSSERQRNQLEDYSFKHSKPRHDAGGLSSDLCAESRHHSTYEPIYSAVKKDSVRTRYNSYDKSKDIPNGEAAIEHHITRAARGHHENKLEKFFHRMGNLLYKNKEHSSK